MALPTGVGRVVVAGTLTRDGQGPYLVQYEIPPVPWCVENKAPLKPIQHVSRFLLKLCYSYSYSITVCQLQLGLRTREYDKGWRWLADFMVHIGLYQPKLPHEMGGRVHNRFHYHYFPPMEGEGRILGGAKGRPA